MPEEFNWNPVFHVPGGARHDLIEVKHREYSGGQLDTHLSTSYEAAVCWMLGPSSKKLVQIKND